MQACIDLMVATMSAVSRGDAVLPLRTVMPVPCGDNAFAMMPGYLSAPATLGAKIVCVFPGNPARGLSSHMGMCVLFDPETGVMRALLDAAAVTAWRTPAATAAASRALARSGAGDLAILGTGEQALGHLDALSRVHALRRIRVWGRDAGRARKFAETAQQPGLPLIEVCADVRQAVTGADLICTVTNAPDPILQGAWISPGAHINLVGASIQTASEIDVAGVREARYFVDYRPSAVAQAGELRRAIDAGAVTLAHIEGEIGEVHLGRIAGRTDDDQITIYKSLGLAAQDIALADAVYRVAVRDGLGTIAEL